MNGLGVYIAFGVACCLVVALLLYRLSVGDVAATNPRRERAVAWKNWMQMAVTHWGATFYRDWYSKWQVKIRILISFYQVCERVSV